MVYTTKQACEILQIGKTKLDRLCRERRIGYLQERKGCNKYFTGEQLDRYVASIAKAERRA